MSQTDRDETWSLLRMAGDAFLDLRLVLLIQGVILFMFERSGGFPLLPPLLAGFILASVMSGAVGYSMLKKIGKGLGWSPLSPILLSVFLTLNASIWMFPNRSPGVFDCGMILSTVAFYATVDRLVSRELAKYGIRFRGLGSGRRRQNFRDDLDSRFSNPVIVPVEVLRNIN